jgi:hypothetical protein
MIANLLGKKYIFNTKQGISKVRKTISALRTGICIEIAREGFSTPNPLYGYGAALEPWSLSFN